MCQRVYPTRESAESEVRAYVSSNGVGRLHKLMTDPEQNHRRVRWDDAKVIAAIVSLSAMNLSQSDFVDLLR